MVLDLIDASAFGLDFAEVPGAKLPKVFHVNWFRKGDDGKFLWPGFGDNLRVLEWMIARVDGKAGATATPIGHLPTEADLNLDGVLLSEEARDKLFGLDHAGWKAELDSIGDYLAEYGPRLPRVLLEEQRRIAEALGRGSNKANELDLT
jgi:phosphoenolpyruvate carboxykinase (GTP)